MKIIFLRLSSEKLRSIQLKSLEIILYFKKICDENNLLFYLCGGGCIGAIRHKGFIPWDDDLDVFMPRQDYEKLFLIWKNTDKYQILRTTKEEFCGNIFTTIVDKDTILVRAEQKNLNVPKGVAIDIFPLDGCPKNKFKRKIQMIWAMIYSLYLAQVVPINHGKIVNFVSNVLLKLVPNKNLRYRIWKFAQYQMSKYKISDCEVITELCAGPHYMKNKYPKEIFSSAILKEFEGYMLPVPAGFDVYLKIAFGDYMKLPSVEDQVPHHNIVKLKI